MAFSRTAQRHEITYLRRRPRVSEGIVGPASHAGGPSLSLRRDAEPAPDTPSARRVRGRVLLSREQPTATLDRRQSAVGSLAIGLVSGGDLSCAWELVGEESGLVAAAVDARVSPEFGRRPLVQLVNRRIVVGLRHVRELRRLLVLASGTTAPRTLCQLHGGSVLETSHSGSGLVFAPLAIYQVSGELVVRREGAVFDSLEAACRAYGFVTTWLPPVPGS